MCLVCQGVCIEDDQVAGLHRPHVTHRNAVQASAACKVEVGHASAGSGHKAYLALRLPGAESRPQPASSLASSSCAQPSSLLGQQLAWEQPQAWGQAQQPPLHASVPSPPELTIWHLSVKPALAAGMCQRLLPLTSPLQLRQLIQRSGLQACRGMLIAEAYSQAGSSDTCHPWHLPAALTISMQEHVAPELHTASLSAAGVHSNDL